MFVKSIADVKIDSSTKREILIILLSNNDVNIGVMVLQMAKFADRIKKAIEGSVPIKNTLKMKEDELKDHIKTLKKDLFGDIFGSAE